MSERITQLSALYHKAVQDPSAVDNYTRTCLENIVEAERENKLTDTEANGLEWKLFQMLDKKDSASSQHTLPSKSLNGWTSTLASLPQEDILAKLSKPFLEGFGAETIFSRSNGHHYPESLLTIHQRQQAAPKPSFRPNPSIKRKFTPDPKPPASSLQFTTARKMLGSAAPTPCAQRIEDNRNLHPTLRSSFAAMRKPEQASSPPKRPRFHNFNPPMKGASREMEAEPQDLKSRIVEHCKTENIEPAMVEIMMNEILDHNPSVTWDDIAGLEFAKNTIKEIVVWPMLRPDLFTGLRGPPKGILLFGPPGTGKTLIGKCIASQAKATFFCVSASSLTSKYVGDGEKLVRALFSVAKFCQPAVVFIDEVDSLLSRRSESEHESSRRLKTEFLVQLDGATTTGEERLLIVGATNRPQDLDEAARRRLVKRIYIPLPEQDARRQIVCRLLTSCSHDITEADLDHISGKTEGYSGADMKHLCKEAAMGPIRDLSSLDITSVTADQVRPVTLADFLVAMKRVRASVGPEDLGGYQEWNSTYGSEL